MAKITRSNNTQPVHTLIGSSTQVEAYIFWDYFLNVLVWTLATLLFIYLTLLRFVAIKTTILRTLPLPHIWSLIWPFLQQLSLTIYPGSSTNDCQSHWHIATLVPVAATYHSHKSTSPPSLCFFPPSPLAATYHYSIRPPLRYSGNWRSRTPPIVPVHHCVLQAPVTAAHHLSLSMRIKFSPINNKLENL